jgi:hypothetical protein
MLAETIMCRELSDLAPTAANHPHPPPPAPPRGDPGPLHAPPRSRAPSPHHSTRGFVAVHGLGVVRGPYPPEMVAEWEW